MGKSEIIKTFLDRGLQITGGALNFFVENPQKLDHFFSKTNNHPTTITLEHVNQLLGASLGVRIVKTTDIKSHGGVNDFLDYFNKRYSVLSSILKKRLDLINLISINKVSEKTKNFSIIGMVKEKNIENNTIILEDRGGEITIVLQKDIFKQLIEDEVVGVVCERCDTDICGKKIIFPDIPLQRHTNNTKEDMYIFVISDLHMGSELFNKESYKNLIKWLNNQQTKLTIFILGDISANEEDVNKFLLDIPSIHEKYIIKGEIDSEVNDDVSSNTLSIQIENMNLFLFHNQRIDDYMNLWGTPEQTIITLIKKRHLDPLFSPESKIYDTDPYLLDTIPDIIVAAHTHIPSIANYKGITIATTGSFVTQPIFWLINLRTRETFKIDFS